MTDHPIKRDFDDAYSLVKGKSTDYAEDTNKFSNFEQAAIAAGTTVEQVFLTLMGIKLARLTQLLANDKAPNYESIDDTLLDAMNYPGLLRAYRRGQRPTSIRDIFDEFAREELGDEAVDDILESEFGRGLIDAVLDDPINDIESWTECIDPTCCGREIDGDFLDAQVDDALAEMGEPPLLDEPGVEWQVGDEFQLTDLRIYTGYGTEKQVMEVLSSVGPYTVTYARDDRVSFLDDTGRSLVATFDEIEEIDVAEVVGWAAGDKFLLTDDRIFPDWRREEPTDRVMSSIGPYEVMFTSLNPDGDQQVHFKGVEFEDRLAVGGTWFARYTEIERA